MPNSLNQKFMQEHVPTQEGETIKEWLNRVAERLCMSHEAVRYYYADKRSKRLDQRSRLKVYSDHITRVSLNHSNLTVKQGELYDDTIKHLRQLCAEILRATDPADKAGG